MAEFRGLMKLGSSTMRNTALGPCSTGIPACVFEGRAVTISFSTIRLGESVSKLRSPAPEVSTFLWCDLGAFLNVRWDRRFRLSRQAEGLS
jgi:hypothetical protein